jgi:hypothetical protein
MLETIAKMNRLSFWDEKLEQSLKLIQLSTDN